MLDPFTNSRKVYFSDENIPFDGVPFTIIGTKSYDCQHGPDRKKAFKQKRKNDNNKVPQKTMILAYTQQKKTRS